MWIPHDLSDAPFFSAAAKVAWRVAAIQRALHGGPVAAAPAPRQAQPPQVHGAGDVQPAPQQQANQHSAGKEHAGGRNKHKGQALNDIKAVGIKNCHWYHLTSHSLAVRPGVDPGGIGCLGHAGAAHAP